MFAQGTDVVVCEYPRLAVRLPFSSLDPARLIAASEVEPNNSATNPQDIALGFGAGQQQDVDVEGKIAPFDHDWFRVQATAGDTIGVAVLATSAQNLDSHVSICNAAGATLLQNDQHGGIASFYPPESPFPAGGTSGDAVLSFAIPLSGTYFVHVEGRGAASGEYVTQLRLRRPPMLSTSLGTKQIVFLDFDGATGVHADDMFGSGGVHNASLTKLDDFLAAWGIPASRRDALIDAIAAKVVGHFDDLLVGTASQIEIRNSKDHPDTFGQPHVSRVIVGGKISELGIPTIGIAEYIDPGNYSTDDTAVVLLDLLSSSASNPNSVLSLVRSPGVSVDDAVAHVVACVITHEAGHYLGCWHTSNSNTTMSIIDRGGNLSNLAGIGNDGILGTADDEPQTIHDDVYANEGVGRSVDVQNVRAQVIASLSVGTLAPLAAAAAVEESIAGLDRASAEAVELRLPSQYTPFNTRQILKLPVQSPDLFTPSIELPADRLGNAKESWKLRLERLRNP